MDDVAVLRFSEGLVGELTGTHAEVNEAMPYLTQVDCVIEVVSVGGESLNKPVRISEMDEPEICGGGESDACEVVYDVSRGEGSDGRCGNCADAFYRNAD